MYVCAVTGWNNSLDDSVLCFVADVCFGSRRLSERRHSSNISRLADFPASCLIVQWVQLVSPMAGNVYLTLCVFFISDVPRDILATHCWDKDVLLVAMKSMVHTVF